jgi:hypothetical protein
MKASEENYVYLLAKIDSFIRKYYFNKVLKGLIFLLASSLIAYIFVITVEHFGRFNSIFRAILYYSFIVINLIVIFGYILIPLLSYLKLGKSISHEQASSIIGEHFSPIKDKLLNTLQLKKLYESNPEQRQLIDASINQKITELKPIPFNLAIRLNDNIKYLKFSLAPLAILIFIFFASPSILSESTTRLINYNKHFVEKAPFEFEILNESLVAEQGSDFTLKVRLRGNQIPAELYLEDGLNTFKLKRENNVRFNYTFKNIQKSLKIKLNAGKFKSDEYSLEVKTKPSILKFDIYIEYPAYLKKKNEFIKNSGDLIVPEGSKISWKFITDNSDFIDIRVNKKNYLLNESADNEFNFSYSALKTSSYQIKPIKNGLQAPPSVNYQIQVIPDLLPIIELKESQDSINKEVLYFTGQLSDDHGLSKLTFNYRVLMGDNKTNGFKKIIEFDKNSNQSNFIHAWDITSIGTHLGEQIEYYFEVFDNDGVNGPKSSKSIVKTLKMPSQEEINRDLSAKSEKTKEKMEEAIKEAKELEKEAKKLNQALLNKNSLSYEDKKQVENLVKKQNDLEKLIKEIQNENKENNLGQKSLENEQILEKQKQIEKLFNDVLDEKTKEILRNIEKLLDKNNKEQSREELSKIQLDNKSLQKELDRILELYKQLEFDQLLSKVIQKLSQMAEQQNRLGNKTSLENANLTQLKNEQNALNEKFNELKAEFNDLNEKNEDLEQKNDFDGSQKDLSQISQDLKESLDNLNKKEPKKASAKQIQAVSKMQELSDKLKKMQEDEEEQENEINKNELRQLLENLLSISFEQEKIMKDLRGISTINPDYVLKIQKQKNIQVNFKLIEDSLYSLSKRIPQIQSLANKEVQQINLNIKTALENLADRKTAEANRDQQYTMTSINNLALMLNEVLDQLEKSQQNGKSGGKGKKKQSLSQLSKMQEQLNKNMQKAKEEMQKQGQESPAKQGKGSMSEAFAKMAREQQLIRQSMQELNRMENKDGKRSLGNLEEIIKEMEQSETDLVNKRIKQETVIRQQEILSKLLEAERAENERDEEEKRESAEGKNQVPINSKIMLDYLKNKEKETDLLKTISPSFNLYYKIKVGDYFRLLNSGNK